MGSAPHGERGVLERAAHRALETESCDKKGLTRSAVRLSAARFPRLRIVPAAKGKPSNFAAPAALPERNRPERPSFPSHRPPHDARADVRV